MHTHARFVTDSCTKRRLPNLDRVLTRFSENSRAQKFYAKGRKEGTNYQIASVKHRIILSTQGLFGSQSLLHLVSVFSQKVSLYVPMSSGSLKWFPIFKDSVLIVLMDMKK